MVSNLYYQEKLFTLVNFVLWLADSISHVYKLLAIMTLVAVKPNDNMDLGLDLDKQHNLVEVTCL